MEKRILLKGLWYDLPSWSYEGQFVCAKDLPLRKNGKKKKRKGVRLPSKILVELLGIYIF